VLEAQTGRDRPEEQLRQLSGVKDVQIATESDWQRCLIRVEADKDLRTQIFELAVSRQWNVRELSQQSATLEDVFVELTHADNA
jgi:ABC-type uncharacterized transport system ATPase subunit